jgi:hypothetical protein
MPSSNAFRERTSAYEQPAPPRRKCRPCARRIAAGPHSQSPSIVVLILAGPDVPLSSGGTSP